MDVPNRFLGQTYTQRQSEREKHAPHTNRQCPNIATIIRIDLFGCQLMRFLVINWCVHSVDSASWTSARDA